MSECQEQDVEISNEPFVVGQVHDVAQLLLSVSGNFFFIVKYEQPLVNPTA